ncbi:DUF5706 domain-containing protein [Leuconostoc suionicum]|uniref:Pycsar system effector family protein n=1 Tax=Leuconostoc suionicum TaxID=1511761 RepID=UPI0024ADD54C|nr:Pycsar system effector family protein [Leuconostoc suionicum]MDI6552120.1 DUF5706 domain-containing protein [Leuconostoc suionicum]
MNSINNSKFEYLKYTLDKQLNWIQKADNKSSIFLSVTGILVTLLMNSKVISIFSIVTEYLFTHDVVLRSIFLLTLFVGIIFVVIGCAFLFFSIIPNLNNISNQNSHIYFGDIAKNDLAELKKFFDQESDFLGDLVIQVFVNAKIANQKMKNCNRGIVCVCVGFVIIFILILISLLSLPITNK